MAQQNPVTVPNVLPKLNVQFFKTDAGNEPVRDWLRNDVSPDERKAIGEDIKTAQFG